MNALWLCLAFSAPENLQNAQKRLTQETVSLTFNTHSSGKSGQLANSHILVSNESAMIVDLQLTEKENGKLIKAVKELNKPLVAVFITSERPEHSKGIDAVKAAFPDAKVYAPKAIAKTLGAEPWSDPVFPFSGEKLQVLPLQRGKKDTAVAIYVPVLQVLIAGDLAWSNAPVPEDELALDKAAWSKRLTSIRTDRKVGTVLTGHGDIGPESVLDDMQKQLGK